MSFLVLILIFHLHLHRLLLIIKRCAGIAQYMLAKRGRTRTRNPVQVQENEKDEGWDEDAEEHDRLVTPSGYSTFSAERLRSRFRGWVEDSLHSLPSKG